MKCRAAPELEMVYPGPYYQFFEQFSDADMQKAINVVEEVVEEEGPYDGVLGFSQVRNPFYTPMAIKKPPNPESDWYTGCLGCSRMYFTATITGFFRRRPLQNCGLLLRCSSLS
jgi:hypothetical protein